MTQHDIDLRLKDIEAVRKRIVTLRDHRDFLDDVMRDNYKVIADLKRQLYALGWTGKTC